MRDMIFSQNERTTVLIDGANAYAAARSLNVNIDWSAFRAFFLNRCDLVHLYYLTALDRTEQNPLVGMVDYLSYNGYIAVTKDAKIFHSEDGARRIKGNMDVELVLLALRAARHSQHIVLFTGDGDFQKLIEEIQDVEGCRVSIISTLRGDKPVCADSLRKQADNFIDLSDIADDISMNR